MKACFRTSLPICSPSRSQSVQMNKILENRACCCMFWAILFLSCSIFSPCLTQLTMCTHVVNTIDDWRIEKLSGRTGFPALILRLKVKAREVTEHARHRHRAIAPLLEIKFEFIVLDILISWYGMLWPWSALQTMVDQFLTHGVDSTPAEMLCHRLRNCRLFSNAENFVRRHVVSARKNSLRPRLSEMMKPGLMSRCHWW